MQRKALTLYELNSLVRDVIETTLDGAYWVEAELSEAREVHGHCYMELVQKDLFGATPVARASAKCWRNTWIRLKPKFERTTGQSLHAGMKVMLLVTANFHEAYGFSWIVQDIDPTYTMGDMARKRLEIINQLKAEGVFDMQKGLELPMFAQHIAVISSEGAAGYGDFCHQLKENDEGFWFYTELFPAVMQGADVEPTVIAALDAINDRLDEFDVVVIIRGGGATADMSGFDTLSLAENVANFPIPVITGIGHDRDESVLDMVSHTRVKTPTAAAAFLVDHLEDVWLHINDCQTRLLNVVNRRMDLAKERLSRLAERIPTLFSLVKVQQTNRVDRLANRLSTLMHELLMHEQYRVQALERVMQPLAQQRLTTERHRLEQLGIRLHSVDPALMLKRGYSITRINGKAVRDASQLKTGDEIETQLEKGTVKSKVV
jgi:exodeoxyribonuclease VII large subunit